MRSGISTDSSIQDRTQTRPKSEPSLTPVFRKSDVSAQGGFRWRSYEQGVPNSPHDVRCLSAVRRSERLDTEAKYSRRRRRADRNRFSPVRRFWRQRSVPKRSFSVRGKRNGPYGRLHGTLGERNQEPANERIQTCEQSTAAISCATCSDPNGCDTRFHSGSFGTHDNLGGSKRKSLPFYRRNRIYDPADRGSRNCLF